MFSMVDKQALVVIKRAVIAETIATTKEHTFAIYSILFFCLVSLSRPFMIHRTAGKVEAISLTPLNNFYALRRHRDISQAITGDGSPLNIVGSRTPTDNLWFPSASR